MSDRTGIEWTDATWNPLRGCSRVSEGCRNCYAERVASRFVGADQPYANLVDPTRSGSKWTGEVALVESALDQPLRWRRPRRIFVNSMSDLFHEKVEDGWLDRIFAIMALAPQHTFQILTKRPGWMLHYITQKDSVRRIYDIACDIALSYTNNVVLVAHRDQAVWPANAARVQLGRWPLPNVWLGVSIENQKAAKARIPILSDTPAAVRFVSAEPLLGPLRLDLSGIDWLIAGGESGPGARPVHPDWARSLRDQCQASGVPFFFKQWGEWLPYEEPESNGLYWPAAEPRELYMRQAASCVEGDDIHNKRRGTWLDGGDEVYRRLGKRRAGRRLDGREWNGSPGQSGAGS